MTKKICASCGIEFEASHQKVNYCSDKCLNESKSIQKSAYNRLYRSGCDEYLGDDIVMPEFQRKNKPTQSDIYEVKKTLNDFGYKRSIKVPDFETYAQLDAWKIDMIDTILS